MPVAFISGTGLIGASMGLGLADAGWDTLGWDPDRSRLDAASALGAITASDPEKISRLDAADLVVLAAPPRPVIETLPALDTAALVIDVAAVKAPVLRSERSVRFVGTHPMAGREQSGPEAASAGLFRGTAWVVTTDGAAEADLEVVDGVVDTLGARPIHMTAAAHDSAVARVSHLPQLVAAALLETAAADPRAMDLAAGSFRDLTRVAASDPSMWIDIIELNREAIAEATSALKGALDGTRAVDQLEQMLYEARALRATLGPALAVVRVALIDEPGELARVGEALAASGVDVRDLQLRHAPHGGGGILTISVRPGETGALSTALIEVGLDVIE
ncbi:MAG: prephenate dehydrogenase [Acidimicrobiia bacterium]|nr:MAG: prephenate dehydrogenase [Acidimicrobiia bacterium]